MLVASFGEMDRNMTELELAGVSNVINNLGLPALHHSEVFYVGSDVTREYLNRALGPEPKQLGTVFPYTTHGLVVFERPIPLDPNSILSQEEVLDGPATNYVPISALSWATGEVPTRTADGNRIAWKPGVVVMLWSRSNDIRQIFMDKTGKDIGESLYSAYPLTYASAANGGWFIPETGLYHDDEDPSASVFYDGDVPETASPSTAVCLAHELWTMLGEEIYRSRKVDATSKQKKMLRRAKMKDTGISVIELRHVENIGDSVPDGERIVDWSNRWYVRGHYRRIRDRHTGEIRHVWVRSHIKGPSDRPLRETEKVYALIR